MFRTTRLISIVLLIATLFACTTNRSDEGRQLANTYCGSCHMVPNPDLLDKHSWAQYMLPRMGVFLGVIEHDSLRHVLTANETERTIAESSGVFPTSPILSSEEWQAIKDYYISNAPDKPTSPERKEITSDLTQFEVVVPPFKLSPPSVTFLRFNVHTGGIFLGDANKQMFATLSPDFQLTNAANVREGAVWMEEQPDEFLVTVMGSFSPTDVAGGFIVSLPKTKGQPAYKVIDSLKRPVHSAVADLDMDGKADIVTCEFAKWTGMLAWHKNNGDGTFTKKILRNKPGAIQVFVRDLDKNGLSDIVALFGQGDEGIWAYYNKGNGIFSEQNLLHFPPSYGSSHFNLFDLNNDGHEDIVYTAGDNADFPPILKHYHGVYIFMNDGKNQFTQRTFFPLNGAYNAVPRDYDLDGDIDIAAISFFPDYANQPEESFVYLRNEGNFKFSAQTISDPLLGRWIVMDVADYDRDGDEDIALGSLAFEVVGDKRNLVDKWVKNGIPFIVLRNNAKASGRER
jgi:hypothetical protein